ncbi:helix-turn-helix domain-containing protein [Granulosicoccus sp.]|nr:helix-turn-helix domain-containing protein [Granulosicoccus sp.]
MNDHTGNSDVSSNKMTNSVDGVADTSHVQSLDSLPTDEFLRVVGTRVRNQRSSMSMSRKRLAEVSGVSERYLAQLESGQGNMSIALLRKVTSAIGLSLSMLLSADIPESGSSERPSLNGSAGPGLAQGGVHTAHNSQNLSGHPASGIPLNAGVA